MASPSRCSVACTTRALIGLTVVVIGFVSYLWWTTASARWISRIGFALIIGGAIGNLIDRSLHGYVIDYILFHLPSWSFAVFNLADAYISIGAALVVIEEFLPGCATGGHETANLVKTETETGN